MSEKKERGARRDYGFRSSKRGLKAGALTIRQWKNKHRGSHPGGASAVNKNPTYWVKMVDGVRYGTYLKGKFLEVLPFPLGKGP